MPGIIPTVDPSHDHQPIQPPIDHIDPSSSYDDLQDGQLSPSESEHSNMTSISQRGVNPKWRPDSGGQQQHYRPGQASLGVPGKRPSQMQQQQQRDFVLNSNPDFEIPLGARPARVPGMPVIQHGQAF